MAAKYAIHIEAPVEKVFDFVKDPKNFEKLPHAGTFKDVTITKEGVGTQYTVVLPIPGLHIESFDVYTEFVPNKRITDWSSLAFAGTQTTSFEPEGSGTKLTVETRPRSFWRIPLLRELAEWSLVRANQFWGSELKAMLEA